MGKKILGLLTLLFPIFVFLAVFQVFRYQSLEEEIALLEAEQREWFDQNRDALSAMAVYNSPARLDVLAEEELELDKIDRSQILKAVRKEEVGENQP